jgi:hypothetical protein
MATGLEVRSVVHRHRADIVGDHDESVPLCPAKELRIARAEGELNLFADTGDLQREGTSRVGSL